MFLWSPCTPPNATPLHLICFPSPSMLSSLCAFLHFPISLLEWQYLREGATCGPRVESADSCMHTLSGGLQLFSHFSHLHLPIFALPFSSFPAVTAFTSETLFHTEIACLSLWLYSIPLFPQSILSSSCCSYPLLDDFPSLANSTDHHAIVFYSLFFTSTPSAQQLLNSTSLTYCFS